MKMEITRRGGPMNFDEILKSYRYSDKSSVLCRDDHKEYNYRGVINTLCQKMNWNVAFEEGRIPETPPHDPLFIVQITIHIWKIESEVHQTKTAAVQCACRKALKRIYTDCPTFSDPINYIRSCGPLDIFDEVKEKNARKVMNYASDLNSSLSYCPDIPQFNKAQSDFNSLKQKSLFAEPTVSPETSDKIKSLEAENAKLKTEKLLLEKQKDDIFDRLLLEQREKEKIKSSSSSDLNLQMELNKMKESLSVLHKENEMLFEENERLNTARTSVEVEFQNYKKSVEEKESNIYLGIATLLMQLNPKLNSSGKTMQEIIGLIKSGGNKGDGPFCWCIDEVYGLTKMVRGCDRDISSLFQDMKEFIKYAPIPPNWEQMDMVQFSVDSDNVLSETDAAGVDNLNPHWPVDRFLDKHRGLIYTQNSEVEAGEEEEYDHMDGINPDAVPDLRTPEKRKMEALNSIFEKAKVFNGIEQFPQIEENLYYKMRVLSVTRFLMCIDYLHRRVTQFKEGQEMAIFIEDEDKVVTLMENSCQSKYNYYLDEEVLIKGNIVKFFIVSYILIQTVAKFYDCSMYLKDSEVNEKSYYTTFRTFDGWIVRPIRCAMTVQEQIGLMKSGANKGDGPSTTILNMDDVFEIKGLIRLHNWSNFKAEIIVINQTSITKQTWTFEEMADGKYWLNYLLFDITNIPNDLSLWDKFRKFRVPKNCTDDQSVLNFVNMKPFGEIDINKLPVTSILTYGVTFKSLLVFESVIQNNIVFWNQASEYQLNCPDNSKFPVDLPIFMKFLNCQNLNQLMYKICINDYKRFDNNLPYNLTGQYLLDKGLTPSKLNGFPVNSVNYINWIKFADRIRTSMIEKDLNVINGKFFVNSPYNLYLFKISDSKTLEFNDYLAEMVTRGLLENTKVDKANETTYLINANGILGDLFEVCCFEPLHLNFPKSKNGENLFSIKKVLI